MNYSEKKISNKKPAKVFRYKRLLILMCICFGFGLLIGNVITSTAMTKVANNVEPTEPMEPVKNQFYGTIDGREFVGEISMDWDSGAELGFVPLNVPMDESMQEFIYCLSYGYSLDFPFVMALIEHESSFQVDVISKSNDYGLMQINKINHKWLTETIGVTDFLDPYQNTRSGIFILRKLFEKYEDPSLVLMAYNMGETGAKRLWKQGVYSTDYVEDILQQAGEYKKQIEERMGE